MSKRSLLSRSKFTLLALVAAGVIAFAQWKGWLPREGFNVPPSETTASHRAPGTVPPNGPEVSRKRIGSWEQLQGCTLVEDRGNDGDSFVIRHGGKEHTLRLYFADCPEKHRHQYNKDRIADQGRYFGGLTEAETTSIGEEARDFSMDLLRKAPFTILTRWDRVFESERHYAFVSVDGRDLAHLLIQNGLARIHTKGEKRPEGFGSAAQEKEQLVAMERKAKTANLGGWSYR